MHVHTNERSSSQQKVTAYSPLFAFFSVLFVEVIVTGFSINMNENLNNRNNQVGKRIRDPIGYK